MIGNGSTLRQDVAKLYDRTTGDVEFAKVLGAEGVHDDAQLAELIEADGRLRIARGKPVRLERYLKSVPDLIHRADALDAAIDVTLRSMSGGASVTAQAVEALIAEHPELELPIREAAALNATLWSTTGLQARVKPPPKPLPFDFGPLMPDGQRRYELQRMLGQGAFGQVYLALDRQLSEKGHTALVAIKILLRAERTPWERQRLIEEATKARRINHPNVVRVLDRGTSQDDEDFIVYEYVDGGELSDAIAAHRPMAIDRTVRLIASTARGVHAAHTAGVVHCDLKPGNVMLTSTGEPKVADFGIAVRLDEAHSRHALGGAMPSLVGNLAFISPEQYRGDDGALSIPADIYALGGILFYLITGKLPNGSTLDEITRTHDRVAGRDQPPSLREHRPEVDCDLDAICRRAMAPRPADRYDSAAALADDLERWLRLEPLAWTRPSLVRITWLWMRRKPALALATAATAVLFAAAVIAAFYAQQLHYQAAVTQVRLEAEQKNEQRQQQVGAALAKSLQVAKEYRLNTDALAKIFVLEYLYGPAVLAWPEFIPELWEHRIRNIRSLVQLAHEQGRGDQLETLLWEGSLAFWLVSDGDYLEAEPLLASTIEKCERRLSPDDAWLEDLQAMAQCATVNRLLAEAKARSEAASDHAASHDVEALHSLRAALNASCRAIEARHKGTPMHFLVLRRLADLHSPWLLNEPQVQEQLKRTHDALLAEGSARQRSGEDQMPAGESQGKGSS